jgi:predicted DCC family thiol-disulfide oxidoreductase YuxK
MPTYTVLYDGGCPMCRRTVRVLRRLDWLKRLTFVDATDAAVRQRIAPGLTEAEVLVEMYVVDQSGARAAGYAGYLWIARVVPLLWPMAVLGPLPGVWHLGDAVYRLIAEAAAPTRCAQSHRQAPANPALWQPRPGSPGRSASSMH